uniref:Thioredoxin related transmembrane protein 4 n=1 Tax=Naja naja TaxID=35670 RepID=A0A8C6X9H0_NAJNA
MAVAVFPRRCCSRWRKERISPLQVMLWGAAGLAFLLTIAASLEPEPVVSHVVELSGSNWSLLLQGQWMVEFYAPWCPVCQQMELAWEAFARNSKELELSVGKVDVTQEPGVSGRFLVTTLPTIYHAKDGVFRRYRGSKTLEDLESYILERKWESIEPVAGWKSPTSLMVTYCGSLCFILLYHLLVEIVQCFQDYRKDVWNGRTLPFVWMDQTNPQLFYWHSWNSYLGFLCHLHISHPSDWSYFGFDICFACRLHVSS